MTSPLPLPKLELAGITRSVRRLFGKKKRRPWWYYRDGEDMVTLAENSPIKRAYGQRVRCEGSVVQMSQVRTLVTSHGSHLNHVDLAVVWCEAPPGGVDSVEKIWANDQPIFVEGATSSVLITSDQISIDADGGVNTFRSVDPSVDLSRVVGGQTVFITGAVVGNNGTFFVLDSGRRAISLNSDGTANFETFMVLDFALGVDQGVGVSTITIDQDLSGTAVGDPIQFAYDELVNYEGTIFQGVDSRLNELNNGLVPAYHGYCYSRFTQLKLIPYNNEVPELRAEIRRRAFPTDLGDILDDLVEDYDSESVITVSAGVSADVSVEGFEVPDTSSLAENLEPLTLFADLYVREYGGRIEFLKRDEADTVEIPADEMNASENGQNRGAGPVEYGNASRGEKPRQVEVTVRDSRSQQLTPTTLSARANKLVPGALGAYSFEKGRQVTEIGVDRILAQQGYAQRAAERQLRLETTQTRGVTCTLSPRYVQLQEGDVIRTTLDGEEQEIQVGIVDIGANSIVACQGVFVDGPEPI